MNNYVYVRFWSKYPERFFNMCKSHDISLKNFTKENDEYYFSIEIKDYYFVKSFLRKTGSKTQIVSKSGPGFEIAKCQKQYCFFIGMFLACLVIYILSLFVWEISVEDNLVVTDEMLIKTLADNNVYHGIMKKDVKCDELEELIRKEYKEVTWTSVELTGTKLIIYIKENDEDYIDENTNKVCDIRASKSGIIANIITRTGTPLVTIGSTVNEGDVIVSGIVNVYDDYGTIINQKDVCADADVLIKTEYHYEDFLFKEYKYKIYTNKIAKLYYIQVNDYLFKVGIIPDYDKSDTLYNDTQMKINESFYLPLHYGSISYYEYNDQNAVYTEEQAQKILEERLNYFIKDLEQKEVQIIRKDVKMYEDNSEFIFRGTIEVLESAVIKSEILREENVVGD